MFTKFNLIKKKNKKPFINEIFFVNIHNLTFSVIRAGLSQESWVSRICMIFWILSSKNYILKPRLKQIAPGLSPC